MRYYKLQPDCPGELGPNCAGEFDCFPPVLRKLHYVLKSKIVDDLMSTSMAIYVATEPLANRLKMLDPSGMQFDDVEITSDSQFDELYRTADLVLPKCFWLKIVGRSGVHDFGYAEDKALVVSERVLDVIKSCTFEIGKAEEYKPEK